MQTAITVTFDELERLVLSAVMPDAVLAQWATQIEEELIAAEKEEC